MQVKHLTPTETNEMLKRLRNGERVVCPFCGKGEFKTKGNYNPLGFSVIIATLDGTLTNTTHSSE